jgi:hypothetical protein
MVAINRQNATATRIWRCTYRDHSDHWPTRIRTSKEAVRVIDLTHLLETEGVPIVRENGAGGAGAPAPRRPRPTPGFGLANDPQFGLYQRGAPEDEEERHLARRRMLSDEDETEQVEDEAESEGQLEELFQAAADGLLAAIDAMRRRRRAATEISD